MDVVDWSTAQRVGELIAGSPPAGGLRADDIEPLAHDFAERVGTYSGLGVPQELPPLELVERPAWIAANLTTMRPMLAPLTERLSQERGPLRSLSGMLLSVQIGALTGMLSQRVLGQYDLALLDASVKPRLLLLAPNLTQASRNLRVDRRELALWVSIHEITHAVQFSGAPWLRGHLGGILTQLLESVEVGPGIASRVGSWLPRPGTSPASWIPDVGDLRGMIARARQGELLRLTLGEDRWQLIEQMQATMSLIEGHAEHTMDVVGAETLPSLDQLRAAMNRRRSQRGLPWRVLERLLGLELKMRQYRTGRHFCDEVVAAAGPEGLARAWSGPEALPSAAELEQPRRWLERMAVATP